MGGEVPQESEKGTRGRVLRAGTSRYEWSSRIEEGVGMNYLDQLSQLALPPTKGCLRPSQVFYMIGIARVE